MDRASLLDKLGGQWRSVEKVLSGEDVGAFAWDVARHGEASSEPFFEVLAKHLEPRHADAIPEFFAKLDLAGRYAFGWFGHTTGVDSLITELARQMPQTLRDAMPKMKPVQRDFAVIQLAAAGVEVDFDAAAKLRFAGVLAAIRWITDWMEALRDAHDEDWPALMLRSLDEPDIASVFIGSIRDHLPRATGAQLLKVAKLTYRVRGTAVELLENLGAVDLDAMEAALFAPGLREPHPFRGVAATMVALARVRSGADVSDRLLELVADDLRSDSYSVLAPSIELLERLPMGKAEALLLSTLEPGEEPPRALCLVGTSPTEQVRAKALDVARTVSDSEAGFVSGLAGLGAEAVDDLAALAEEGGVPGVMATAALGQYGAAAAARLVALLGHRTKSVRTRAHQSLLEVGIEARPALDDGVNAKKKAVREASRSLLDVIPASAEPDESTSAVPDDVELVMERVRAKQGVTVDEIVALRGQHGLVVLEKLVDAVVADLSRPSAQRLRDVAMNFLEEPGVTAVLANGIVRARKTTEYVIGPLFTVLELSVARNPDEAGAVAGAAAMPSHYRERFLVMLRERKIEHAADLYYAVLSDSSKSVRIQAVTGLADHPEVDPMRVAALLSARKKDARIAAAEVLARIDASEVLPALRAALDGEKVDEVKVAIEAAIAAQGGTAFELPGPDESEEKVEEFLESLASSKDWTFLGGTELSIVFASGRSLSAEAVRGVLTRLSTEDGEFRDSVIEGLAARFDAESLDRFSGAVYDAWLQAGAPSKERWALLQLGVIAAAQRLDDFALDIDELGSTNHHQARWCLDTLARHTSRHALAWLSHWAAAAERSSVWQRANELFDAAAEREEVAPQQLAAQLNPWVADDAADRRTPTLGLEKAWRVDYGARQFDVVLSPNHELQVVDVESGKRTKSLPSPRKAETLEDEVKARFSALKSDLRKVVKEVSARLEQAMVSGRRWKPAAFAQLFGEHPIISRFASRLVFNTTSGQLFRYADAEAFGVEYDPVRLADGEVWIAHRYDLTEGQVAAWSEHLAEAEIFEPFAQLTRPLFKTTFELAGETTRLRLASRLRSLGWRPGLAEDGGWVFSGSRTFAGYGLRAWIDHDGYNAADPTWDGGESCAFGVEFRTLLGEEVAVQDVDPRVFSEVASDVAALLRD